MKEIRGLKVYFAFGQVEGLIMKNSKFKRAGTFSLSPDRDIRDIRKESGDFWRNFKNMS